MRFCRITILRLAGFAAMFNHGIAMTRQIGNPHRRVTGKTQLRFSVDHPNRNCGLAILCASGVAEICNYDFATISYAHA
jgi:hypothetical protein